MLGGLLLTILVVSAGAIAYRAATSLAHAAIVAEPPPGRAAALAPAVTAPLAEQPDAPDTTPHQGDSIPFNEPIPPPVAPALAAPAAPSASAVASAAAPSPVIPSRPPPTPAELQQALQTTPIVMYSTSWCGVCRKARQFLSENGLRYQDIDVDQTPDGWSKVMQLAGQRAVPVIVVDDKVMLGLDPDTVMRSVARSMERRLGITGIAFKSK
ncbi:MAG TPA: glutaredoxin family protein [Polyangiaceae bacterium]|nr:glutaredoxin family protein [Polyangiaceae bacterium]